MDYQRLVYQCLDCGHPDNDIDPKTKKAISPIHVIMSTVKALLLSRAAGTLPREFHGQKDGMAGFCLLCNRICLQGFEYVVE